MSTTQAGKKERFHFLDGLRAIASVLVLLHHSVTSAVASIFTKLHLPFVANLVAYSTQSGVMLFFVLSGVVLLRPYLRGERKFNTLDYFWRRARRIYPPFFAALIFGYLVMFFIKIGPQTYYVKLFRWQSVAWQELLRQAPIINTRGIYYNLAWWSLQVEVIFYILVPLFLVFFTIRKKRELNYPLFFGTITLVLLATYAVQMYFHTYYPTIYTPYDYDPRVKLDMYRFLDAPVAFVLGIYLAKYDFKKSAGYILLVAGAVIVPLAGRYAPMINSGYAILYAGLIILIFNSQRLQSILDRPIMVWLGERSYSLFLIHFSVFYLVCYICSMYIAERNWLYGVCSRGIGIPLAFFLAMVLFHFVERRQARGLVTGHIFWPWQLKKKYPRDLKEK